MGDLVLLLHLGLPTTKLENPSGFDHNVGAESISALCWAEIDSAPYVLNTVLHLGLPGFSYKHTWQ